MNERDFKIVLAIIIPIAILLGVAVKVIAHKIDVLIDIQYDTCVNSMSKEGDFCGVRL